MSRHDAVLAELYTKVSETDQFQKPVSNRSVNVSVSIVYVKMSALSSDANFTSLVFFRHELKVASYLVRHLSNQDWMVQCTNRYVSTYVLVSSKDKYALSRLVQLTTKIFWIRTLAMI